MIEINEIPFLFSVFTFSLQFVECPLLLSSLILRYFENPAQESVERRKRKFRNAQFRKYLYF